MSAASGGATETGYASAIPPELGDQVTWDVMQNSRLIDAIDDDRGLCGIHLTPSPWGIKPSDRWFYPLYAECVEHGLPVFTYVGAPGPLWPMDLNNPAHLDEVALAFPDLTIIAHHIGDPWTDMAVRLAARHEHFYICTSAWSPKAYPAALTQFLGGDGMACAAATERSLLPITRSSISPSPPAMPAQCTGSRTAGKIPVCQR